MKRFIIWAAIFSLPFPSKAQVINPVILEDTFQSNVAWDLYGRGLGNINADNDYLPLYNADVYVTTWDGGEPVADIKYGGFVVRQYPHGMDIRDATTPTFEQYKTAFPNADFDDRHISSLEAGFFQFNGETYIALTYFGIDYAAPTSGKFYIEAYKWDPGAGTLTPVPAPTPPNPPTPTPLTNAIPLNATDGWIHQDINDQNEIVVTWDVGGKIFTATPTFNALAGFNNLTGTGILDVPIAGLGQPDVAMSLLPNGNSEIYYVFTSAAADDAPYEGLWVYKGDYNSLSSLIGTQPYAVDSVYHKSTEGHFGLPRIDMPNTSASPDDAAWSIVVADHHEPHEDIFAASYSNGPGLNEQVLNDGSLGSLPDISLFGIYKHNRPTVAFSPIDNELYYAWVFENAPESPTYISVKTKKNLSLLNNPPTGYFLIPFKLYYEPSFPGVALSTNNTFNQLYTAFFESLSFDNLYIILGMKSVDWGANGYKPSGISETNQQNVFSVYPNPFREGFQIKATSPTNQDWSITVFNLLGQKVYQANGSRDKINKGLQSIGHNLNSGTYFMEIKDTDGRIFRKEVVKW